MEEANWYLMTSELPTHPLCFPVKIFSSYIFWEPLRNSNTQPILRMRSPTFTQASPAPMQIIDFVPAKVAARGELGAKV